MPVSETLRRLAPLLLLAGVVSCSEAAGGEVTVTLRSDDTAVGTVTLRSTSGQTRFQTHFDGLPSGGTYRLALHGGSCEQPSASMALLLTFPGDTGGGVQREGPVQFQQREPVTLQAIADGEHVLLLTSDRFESCGAIPALKR